MVERLSPETRASLQAELPDWEMDETSLFRVIGFADFTQAFGFMTCVALLAQQQNHHPDMSIRYRTVGLQLTTHEISDLSVRDIAMAKAIDKLLD